MADPARPRRWYFPNTLVRSAILRPRVIAGVAAGILSLLALPHSLSVSLHWAFAWDIGGMVYLVLAFELMARTPPERIRARAARQDDGRFTLLVLIILAIASSFAAIIGLLGEAKEVDRATRLGFLAAAAFTILISWTVTQVLFAIHYAHEHFLELDRSSGEGALLFPEEGTPDYWDFFYFATSIGATSQTSDVSICSKLMRRLVTFHAIIAFFFNTTVLALTINLAASLAG